MRAALFNRFRGPIEVQSVADPVAAPGEVVVDVLVAGLCRSDFHGWHGTDPDIVCPHVGGHEFVGLVRELGAGVTTLNVGDRVVAPFVCGCGSCEPCRLGHHQVCRQQVQPGFTRWGAFAEQTTIAFADVNAVRVPDRIDDEIAALVGCRVSTAYRGVVERGRLSAGETMCVYGCGGVGLACIAFAKTIGATVVAVDVSASSLQLAGSLGADYLINASDIGDVGQAVRELNGGAHMSVDCLGNERTATNSIRSLRPLGRHVQIGLFPNPLANLPIGLVIRDELEILGVHGQSSSRFDPIFEALAAGLDLTPMITARLSLDDIATALPAMASYSTPGVSVVHISK